MPTTVDYSTFKSLVSDGQIKRVRIADAYYVGLSATETELNRLRESGAATPAAPLEWRTVRVEDPGFVTLLDQHNVQYFAEPQGSRPLLGLILQWVIPLGLMFLVWRFMFKRLGSMGSNVMAFGKSRAQVVAEGETGVRFADVAGADEAKAELEEVVDFLKSPERYVEIGGKIPAGVLLVGAPGTGKTLLARAVAGEASVTFFRLNGADFVEMFVGVGAARVRDLFKQAREKSPCIIFIDELDAIGKSRGMAITGGNDEREQTLNQLLVEMDGFDARSGVIILGATNRPEVLDAALLRPGRFDRQVLVDKRTWPAVRRFSRSTAPGSNWSRRWTCWTWPASLPASPAPTWPTSSTRQRCWRCARAASWCRSATSATPSTRWWRDWKSAAAYSVRRRRKSSPTTRRAMPWWRTTRPAPTRCARSPSCRAGWALSAIPCRPRPRSASCSPKRRSWDGSTCLLGGRGAEEVVFSEISTGAANDLDRSSDMAKRMVTDYGMSEKFANVRLPYRQESPLLGHNGHAVNREYSEATQQYIDEETARIIGERYRKVVNLLRNQGAALKAVAARLLEKEVLESAEFADLAGTPAALA